MGCATSAPEPIVPNRTIAIVPPPVVYNPPLNDFAMDYVLRKLDPAYNSSMRTHTYEEIEFWETFVTRCYEKWNGMTPLLNAPVGFHSDRERKGFFVLDKTVENDIPRHYDRMSPEFDLDILNCVWPMAGSYQIAESQLDDIGPLSPIRIKAHRYNAYHEMSRLITEVMQERGVNRHIAQLIVEFLWGRKPNYPYDP